MMIRDHEKLVYTAILGKVIAVYLGRPFESCAGFDRFAAEAQLTVF